jgi:DNA (cytosine-5)-methyltransferase 1
MAEQPMLLDPETPPDSWDYSKPDFRFIDLFAGIGGMRIAFEAAGGKCVFTSEWDANAQKTYQANFGELPSGDITQVNENEISDFDVLLAGFPCQPFSTIGQREGFKHKTQGTLFYDVLRIIEAKKPSSFLLENVKGLVSHDSGKTLRIILESLTSIGYQVEYKILDAADFGVPQHRKRIYIVGFDTKKIKGEIKFFWPKPSQSRVGIGQFVESGIQDHSISEHLQKSYFDKLDDGRPQIITRESDFPVKTLVSTYHKIQRLTGTFVKDGPTGVRLLTANECKAIMGFPENFIIPVSRTQMYRQMGNSVAVPVVRALAQEIAATLLNAKVIKKQLT